MLFPEFGGIASLRSGCGSLINGREPHDPGVTAARATVVCVDAADKPAPLTIADDPLGISRTAAARPTVTAASALVGATVGRRSAGTLVNAEGKPQ